MDRITTTPRPNWSKKMEDIGFPYHSVDDKGNLIPVTSDDQVLYWREDAYYRFTSNQIDLMDDAINEVHAIMIDVATTVINNGDMERLGITDPYWQQLITDSFKRDDPSLYGRFDIVWDGKADPKFIEYNADTPTSIVESSLAQWFWLNDKFGKDRADQFNSIHEKLSDTWRRSYIRHSNRVLAKFGTTERPTAGFIGSFESVEDSSNLAYMMSIAAEAGFQTVMLDIADLGTTNVRGARDQIHQFLAYPTVDQHGVAGYKPIDVLFKLYPWEWFADDDKECILQTTETEIFEPAWKSVLSNKAIWAVAWEMHKGHPFLLPTSFSANGMESYAKKPFFSREGANIELINDGKLIESTQGMYGEEGFIYQQLVPIKPVFDSKLNTQLYPVFGGWVVGGTAAGMAIREDYSKVTKDTSFFVPHMFE